MPDSGTSLASSDDWEVRQSSASYNFPSGRLSRAIRCENAGDLNLIPKSGGAPIATPFAQGEVQQIVATGFATSSVGRVTIYY